MTGELKIPGCSAYLHPVGDGLLLGVGQNADLRTDAGHPASRCST
ncbi:MAG: beta-propeller domain-containing protein [Ilumatobacteraceae bacterium]